MTRPQASGIATVGKAGTTASTRARPGWMYPCSTSGWSRERARWIPLTENCGRMSQEPIWNSSTAGTLSPDGRVKESDVRFRLTIIDPHGSAEFSEESVGLSHTALPI